jgi:hypothetical protein
MLDIEKKCYIVNRVQYRAVQCMNGEQMLANIKVCRYLIPAGRMKDEKFGLLLLLVSCLAYYSMKLETISSSETSGSVRTTRSYNPEYPS